MGRASRATVRRSRRLDLGLAQIPTLVAATAAAEGLTVAQLRSQAQWGDAVLEAARRRLMLPRDVWTAALVAELAPRWGMSAEAITATLEQNGKTVHRTWPVPPPASGRPA